MRSAPTLKSWMMPFSSVAMSEKLALVRIAFCRAPVLSSASWRRISLTRSAMPGSSATTRPYPASDMGRIHLKREIDDYPGHSLGGRCASAHEARLHGSRGHATLGHEGAIRLAARRAGHSRHGIDRGLWHHARDGRDQPR